MYHIEIENSGSSLMKVKSKDYEFVTDPKGEGITPSAALLASLGGCIGVYINRYVEGAKLSSGGFRITVDAEFSKEKPVSFREIKVSVDLKGLQIDERRKEALLRFVRNCPVHNTLKSNPAVEISLL